jgi:hypothetical protein
MAYELKSGFDFSLPAAGTIAQYRIVTVNSSSQAAASGATSLPAGVLQQGVTVGQASPIQCVGISKVEAGAAITAGAKVSSNASGQAITSVTTSFPIGIALAGAGGAGEYIPVLLNPSMLPMA